MKIAVSSCVILLVIFSCARRNESLSDQNAINSFPGKPGDSWLYHVTDTAFTSQRIDSIREYDMEVSVVDSTILPGGIKSNIWIYRSPDGTDTNYVVSNADTINFAVFRGTEMIFIRRYIVPLQLHSSWEYSTNSVNDVTVDSVADILVGSNMFHGYHIFGYPGRPDEIINIEEWVANDIGIVKRYYNNSGTTNPSQHHIAWSLVSYHLQ